jgi:anti-sigma B factor antagonist
MKVTGTVTGNSATVVVSGDVDSETSPAVMAEIQRVVKGDVNTLFLDLSEVMFLSSSGLSVLIEAQQKVASFGVSRGNRIVDRLLELVGLTNLYGDEEPREPQAQPSVRS